MSKHSSEIVCEPSDKANTQNRSRRPRAFAQHNAFKDIDESTSAVGGVIRIYCDVLSKNLGGQEFIAYMAKTFRERAPISLHVPQDSCHHQAIKDVFEINLVNCPSLNIAQRSQIVYQINATIWPEVQAHMIRRFNKIERDIRMNPTTYFNFDSRPSILSKPDPQWYRAPYQQLARNGTDTSCTVRMPSNAITTSTQNLLLPYISLQTPSYVASYGTRLVYIL